MMKQLDCYCWSCSFQWRVLWHDLPNIKESRKERNICFGLENIHIIYIFCRVFFAECIQNKYKQQSNPSKTTPINTTPLYRPNYITNSFNAHSQFPLHIFLLHTFNLLINHNDNIRELTTPPNTAKTPQHTKQITTIVNTHTKQHIISS